MKNNPSTIAQPKMLVLSYRNQQGVALLTVLLMVVIIVVMVGSMLASQRLSLRQYELLLTQDQMMQDIQSAEQVATALIAADAKVNDSDSLQDAWAQPLSPIVIDNHRVQLSIYDASSRFNINNLYHDGAADPQAVLVFQRLLTKVDLEPELAFAVLDWQDPDSIPAEEGGAEAPSYIGFGGGNSNDSGGQSANSQMAYSRAQISNQPFVSVDELMSVKGFSPETVNSLRPYITAVPYYLPINLNTASPVVLSALLEDGEEAQFQDLLQQRKNNAINTLDEALMQPPWAMMPSEAVESIKPMLDIRSRAFEVLIDVSVHSQEFDQSAGQTTDAQTNQNQSVQHRYATTYISKIDEKQIESGLGVALNNTDATNLGNAKKPSNPEAINFKIQSFGRQLWTYRPPIGLSDN